MQCKESFIRQYTVSILLIFLMLLTAQTSNAAIKGGVKYSIPVYYGNLSEDELNQKAETYYNVAKQISRGVLNEDMTRALVIYSVLQNVNPQNPIYPVRLGILYDRIGKDRQAKGEFSRAIGINSSNWEPYFYFGEFYYERMFYRNALKYYLKACEKSEIPNYDVLYKIGDIYEKFGDTQKALFYLKKASLQNSTEELFSKIERIQTQDAANKNYYNK